MCVSLCEYISLMRNVCPYQNSRFTTSVNLNLLKSFKVNIKLIPVNWWVFKKNWFGKFCNDVKKVFHCLYIFIFIKIMLCFYGLTFTQDFSCWINKIINLKANSLVIFYWIFSRIINLWNLLKLWKLQTKKIIVFTSH